MVDLRKLWKYEVEILIICRQADNSWGALDLDMVILVCIAKAFPT